MYCLTEHSASWPLDTLAGGLEFGDIIIVRIQTSQWLTENSDSVQPSPSQLLTRGPQGRVAVLFPEKYLQYICNGHISVSWNERNEIPSASWPKWDLFLNEDQSGFIGRKNHMETHSLYSKEIRVMSLGLRHLDSNSTALNLSKLQSFHGQWGWEHLLHMIVGEIK